MYTIIIFRFSLNSRMAAWATLEWGTERGDVPVPYQSQTVCPYHPFQCERASSEHKRSIPVRYVQNRYTL